MTTEELKNILTEAEEEFTYAPKEQRITWQLLDLLIRELHDIKTVLQNMASK